MRDVNVLDKLGELVRQMQAKYLLALLDGNEERAKAWLWRKKGTERAIRALSRLGVPITGVEGLEDVPGVGKGTISRIEEILETGDLAELGGLSEEEKERVDGVLELMDVINIGPATAKKMVVEWGITSVSQLQAAVESGERQVNSKIALGLKYYGKVNTRIPRSITTIMSDRLSTLAESLGLTLRVCGSYRRGRPFSSDIDALVYSREYYDTIPGDGDSPLSQLVRLGMEEGLFTDAMTDKKSVTKWLGFATLDGEEYYRVDLLFLPYRSLATAMTYYTGPYELNSIMRARAKRMCLKLNEHYYVRLTADGRREYIYPSSEAEVFAMVEMEYLTPVERDSYRLG